MAVGAGVGVAVGAGAGVEVGVGEGVGAGVAVGRGVGVGVGFAVGVGAGVAVGAGAAVRRGVGDGVETGVAEGVAATIVGGVDVANGDVGEAGAILVGEAVGTTEPDGVADPVGGGAALVGETGFAGLAGPAVVTAVGLDRSTVGVGTTAIASVGRGDVVARCWSSTPPIPRAIVARTRFRTPRLRMSRAR